jgi:hypothetical protein
MKALNITRAAMFRLAPGWVFVGKNGKYIQIQGKWVGYMDGMSKEYCRKCGAEVYPFSKKYSVSASEYFCVKCAERADSEYIIKNSCSVCNRLLGKNEVKVVMPSKAYSIGPVPLLDRLVCTQCYKKVASRNPDRRSFAHRMQQVRAGIRKSIAKRAVESQYVRVNP